MEELSEKEQLEEMRAWWSEYGNYVIGGIVIGVAIMVGVSQFNARNLAQQTEASALFETVFEAVAGGDVDEAEAAASSLYADYEATVYPTQARLAMARLYMDKSRDEDAANALRAVVDSEVDTELGMIGRLRLAKILLYQNKAEEVVELLSDQPESAFTPRLSVALGDAYVLLGDYAAAQDAYVLAQNDSPTLPTIDRALVQMKIDDLPDLADVTEAAAGDDAEEAPVAEDTVDATQETAAEETAAEETDGESE